MKITQTMKEGPSQSGLDTEFQVTVDSSPGIIYQLDKTGVTALSWVETPGKWVSHYHFGKSYVNITSACSCALQTWRPSSLV
jgi:hypothetical protein